MERIDRLRRETVGEPFVVIDGRPSLRVDADRSQHVLRDRARREAVDVVERRAPHDRAAPDEVGGVPAVASRLDEVVEKPLLGPDVFLFVVGAVLERVDVVELLRRLGEGDLLVPEIADEAIDEMRERRVVRVENSDELGGRVLQSEVDVAGLRVLVALAREVDAPELLAERLDLGAVPVVEKKSPVRILEIVAGEERLAQNRNRLVLRRNEDVDGASGERFGHNARYGPPYREEEEKRRERAETFRDEERPREEERRFVEGRRDPPVKIIEGHDHRDDGDDAAKSLPLEILEIFHEATFLL